MIRHSRLTILIIVLLTTGMFLKRLLAPAVAYSDAPYPLRLLATAEPSSLLLLTLVLLVILLVHRRRRQDKTQQPPSPAVDNPRKMV